MERVMRLRQPAAVVVLVALALAAVLRVASALKIPLPDGPGLAYLATAIIEPVLLLVMTTLLVTCWLGEPTRSARTLTLAALGLTAVLSAAVVGLSVASMIAMPWPQGGLEVDAFTWLVPPVTIAGLSLAIQVALLRRPATQAASAAETGPIPTELWSEPEGEPAPDPELQPTWTPDQAVGTVWRRAGDASLQTAATDWDESGEAGGWWSTEPERGPIPEPRSRTES